MGKGPTYLGVEISELAGMSLAERLSLAERHGWAETPDPSAMSVDEYLMRMVLSAAVIIWRVEYLMRDVIATGDASEIRSVRKLHRAAVEHAREMLEWAGLTVSVPKPRRTPVAKLPS